VTAPDDTLTCAVCLLDRLPRGPDRRHLLGRLARCAPSTCPGTPRREHRRPAADYKVPPYHQSWTSLHDLRAGTPYHDESVRRALRKLAVAGLVETRLLCPVRWHHDGHTVRGGLPPDAVPPEPFMRRRDFLGWTPPVSTTKNRPLPRSLSQVATRRAVIRLNHRVSPGPKALPQPTPSALLSTPWPEGREAESVPETVARPFLPQDKGGRAIPYFFFGRDRITPRAGVPYSLSGQHQAGVCTRGQATDPVHRVGVAVPRPR
jgi:hypothetical protein